ncbi:MAG: copper-translocating P-type ATPase [bacterium]|nr:copper-translocating P-type ATPase [bacterium]
MIYNNKQRKHCTCEESCLCCQAEELTVSSGSDIEAKQYEYNLSHKLKHARHDHEAMAMEGHEMKLYECPECGLQFEDEKWAKRCEEWCKKHHSCNLEITSHAVDKNKINQPNHLEHTGHDMSKMSHMDHEAAMINPMMAKEMEEDMRRRFWIAFILTIPIFLLSPVGTFLLKISLPNSFPTNWILFILSTPVVFWSGSIFIIGTYYSLKNKKLNMSVLIATGVLTSYIFSVYLTIIGSSDVFYEAAAMLVTFVLFGHWMEMRSRRGTSDSLRALFDLVPPKANIIRDGKEISIPSAEIMGGNIVILRPGDKIPVDGDVTEGETSIDESLVTGESIPVTKKIGDKVIGGSVNQTGSVQYRATKVGSDTVLAQIIKLVETAQNSKAPGQRIADRAAAWLVILAIGAGIATFLGWYVIAGVTLLTALTFAVSAVVIACPDALGLATPTAVAVGTGIGAKHNILIKDAATLENTSRLQVIVLDKTGTLTLGKPKVTDIIPAKGSTIYEILSLTASGEAKSGHPLSQAVIEETKKRNISYEEKVEKFSSLAGLGIEAVVGGKHILVGTIRLMNEQKIDIQPVEADIERLLNEGKTLMILAIDGKVAGVVAAADVLRPTAKSAISKLKEMGLETAMITGDNRKTAEAIGKQLGIDRIFAEVLPRDKADYVKKLQGEGKFVAMVGDGINDAPALAQADIGIAIGAGTDVAIETGNIVLMKSDPYDIVRAMQLSRATVGKMKQNLFWASIYNILAIPVAAGVFYTSLGISLRPEISALLMSASSIIVATNAVLLKRVEPKLK